ncbi:rRNA-processing protein fcf1 [Dissostichus eleginoides]|nr:rRNA-processing protein fcf1 [Dissostichus eleginoides]
MTSIVNASTTHEGKGRRFHSDLWTNILTMGKQKTKKFAAMKRMINLKDNRIKEKDRAKPKEKKKKDPSALKEREVTKYPSCLFFQYNTQLGPPYHVIVDTNFINFSIKAKLDIVQSMMDCLYAKCIPCITDCVMAEIEKLGMKYRVALRIAKDPRFERLPCTHKGTYADDCLVQRVTQHKCYILATVDRDLKRRVRKIPGVPIMYISNHRFNIERMPDDYDGDLGVSELLVGRESHSQPLNPGASA